MVTMQLDEMGKGRTRITQSLWLERDGAALFLDGVRLFETTTPEGLKRIAATIEKAQSKAGVS